jgi:hypothetical protein
VPAMIVKAPRQNELCHRATLPDRRKKVNCLALTLQLSGGT